MCFFIRRAENRYSGPTFCCIPQRWRRRTNAPTIRRVTNRSPNLSFVVQLFDVAHLFFGALHSKHNTINYNRECRGRKQMGKQEKSEPTFVPLNSSLTSIALFCGIGMEQTILELNKISRWFRWGRVLRIKNSYLTINYSNLNA